MFKLSIECSKDISFLKINFTDGTCISGENLSSDEKEAKPKKPKVEKSSEIDRKIVDKPQYHDKIENYQQTSQFKKVKLPDIPDREKTDYSIAEEMQNLEI